jgi:hypothetical protein
MTKTMGVGETIGGETIRGETEEKRLRGIDTGEETEGKRQERREKTKHRVGEIRRRVRKGEIERKERTGNKSVCVRERERGGERVKKKEGCPFLSGLPWLF